MQWCGSTPIKSVKRSLAKVQSFFIYTSMKNHIMLKSLGIFVNKFVNKTILVDGIYCSV